MGINKVVGTILSITGALLSVDNSAGITIMFGGLTLIILTDFIDSVSIEYEITKYPHEFDWGEDLNDLREEEQKDESKKGAKLKILEEE